MDTAPESPPIEFPVPDGPVPFSLDLSDDQRDIRDWVHGFAADVVRPAACLLYTSPSPRDRS